MPGAIRLSLRTRTSMIYRLALIKITGLTASACKPVQSLVLDITIMMNFVSPLSDPSCGSTGDVPVFPNGLSEPLYKLYST